MPRVHQWDLKVLRSTDPSHVHYWRLSLRLAISDLSPKVVLFYFFPYGFPSLKTFPNSKIFATLLFYRLSPFASTPIPSPSIELLLCETHTQNCADAVTYTFVSVLYPPIRSPEIPRSDASVVLHITFLHTNTSTLERSRAPTLQRFCAF